MSNLATAGGSAAAPFALGQYTVKRPFLTFLGRKFHVYAPDGQLVAFVKHPLLKLKQEFTIYADESETMPLMHVKGRQLIALNMSFDVFDAGAVLFLQFRGLAGEGEEGAAGLFAGHGGQGRIERGGGHYFIAGVDAIG